MPARELRSSYDAPPNVAYRAGTMLLKKHKILPHPREPLYYPSTPPPNSRDLVIEAQTSSSTGSDTSSPPRLKHASRRIGATVLPPTPPTPPNHSRQSSRGNPTLAPAPKFKTTSIASGDAPSTPTTPHHSQSPPTPDVTPPRAMPLAFRPPISDRYPSSRTDSFRTARETPYSSDEDQASTVRPALNSARTSAAEVPQLLRKIRKRKEVGLGLGLESDNERTTTPRPRRGESVVFDGEWAAGGEESEVEREWDDNLLRNVTVCKRPPTHPETLHLFIDEAMKEVVVDDTVSPTSATRVVRGLPLQERIARHRLIRDSADRSSTENFAELIAWPACVADPESPQSPDVRRTSTMSGNSVSSAVVEALVVDGPPLRRKTLRHSKKRLGLRDFSSDQSERSSAPESVISNDPRHRLHHAAARTPERRHRSLASNTTSNTTSSGGRSRKEVMRNGGIPVVVIPDRRSSSKTRPPTLRSTSSKKTKRSNSLHSAPRIQSSKYNEPGYFDMRLSRNRTMSDSAGSGHSVRTIDFPPSIPARRSSLSAPTSRNTSRAGSLTAESLNAHNMILKQKQETMAFANLELLHPPVETERETETHSNLLNVDHNGDPFFGKRLSAQATPFSQTSYETAGTSAEVSEAMAVTLFSHQNRSVLVVQHRPSSEDSPSTLKQLNISDTPPAEMSVNEKLATGPVTPPQPSHPMDEVESPLRNPRDPPEPPAIKFIPPTPAGFDPWQEEDGQLGFDMDERPVSSGDKSKRKISLLRRAFSNRRNPEALVPTAGLLKRTFSLSGGRRNVSDGSTQTSKERANLVTLYPSVDDRPADAGKLHPFWRPSHFWDDLERDRYFEDEDYGYPPIDNRPPPPQRTLSQKLKRTFAILPIEENHYHDTRPHATDRRTIRRTSSGSMKVVKQRSNTSLRRDGNHRNMYKEDRSPVTGPPPGSFGYGFKEGNGGRVHTIPGLGLRVEYVGWSGMRDKLREKRREQRSEKLRASISGPKGVKNGMDDVLRRRATAA
ncbi:hypothetical protein LZ554_007360 [Drepanopeziza brunnea f. sp. 'monogermtubi']|nr:hypothetical protein LZ554_007360 [Drepanopeziza brunnea f. sp. 'monogermtubi']